LKQEKLKNVPKKSKLDHHHAIKLKPAAARRGCCRQQQRRPRRLPIAPQPSLCCACPH